MSMTKKVTKRIERMLASDTDGCIAKALKLMHDHLSVSQKQLYTGIEVVAAIKTAAELKIDANCMFDHGDIQFIEHANHFVCGVIVPKLPKQRVINIIKSNVLNTLNTIVKVQFQQNETEKKNQDSSNDKTTISTSNAIVVLECCKCGDTKEVKFEDYFGEYGVCGKCENTENYILATKIKEE